MIRKVRSACEGALAAPLAPLPNYCGYHSASNKIPSPYPEDIVSYVCYDAYNGNQPWDPYCCQVGWDSQCVAEAQQVMSAADSNSTQIEQL